MIQIDSVFVGQGREAVGQALQRLIVHFQTPITLTGSIALEAQLISRGRYPRRRQFGDIDATVVSLDALPPIIATEFICLHVHPLAKPGGILVQFVNPQDAVRIDVFGGSRQVIGRAQDFALGERAIRILSLEDLAAKTACLLLKLKRGGTVSSKHAGDFAELVDLASTESVELVWQDYRTRTDPATFGAAVAEIKNLVRERPKLLVDQQFSKDLDAICPKCRETGPFKPADPKRIFDILGYV